jgi:glycosyltransferase involved in cell wall biosynthesis
MSFHHLLNRGVTDYGLVIAGNGKGGYYEKIRSYVNKYSLEKQITFLGYVSDEEVSYLYKHAVALVYPSFIEGFGFPVLEAMDCGLPVITSTTSSLPEVAGEAALLVDPYSKDAITDALERLVRDKGLREELVKKGHEQRKKFSWEKTGKQLLSIIEAQS